MAQQAVFDMFGLQGLLEQRIVFEVDHAHRKVIARTPIRIHQFKLFIS
jgi:hypothetical protein